MKDAYEIQKNRFGFFEIKDKPTADQLKLYYEQKYYQEGKGNYQKTYSETELLHISNKLEEKHFVACKYLPQQETYSLLDVGCGEGFALKFFSDKDFKVTGLDYSDFGCKSQNPEYCDKLITGDIYENLQDQINRNIQYDVILLDNVLEHVTDPLDLLKSLQRLVSPSGVLIVEVPNDFSAVQKYLLEKNKIEKEFWIVYPDHLSYFNREGLINLCKEAGWSNNAVISDFPIDLNLFNANTNYINNRDLGKSGHLARVEIENLLHSISLPDYIDVLSAYAKLGIGRQIIGFFQKEI